MIRILVWLFLLVVNYSFAQEIFEDRPRKEFSSIEKTRIDLGVKDYGPNFVEIIPKDKIDRVRGAVSIIVHKIDFHKVGNVEALSSLRVGSYMSDVKKLEKKLCDSDKSILNMLGDYANYGDVPMTSIKAEWAFEFVSPSGPLVLYFDKQTQAFFYGDLHGTGKNPIWEGSRFTLHPKILAVFLKMLDDYAKVN